MPFPIVAAGGWLASSGLFGSALGGLGITEQRLRTPAQNRAARVRQINEAVDMARRGERLGVQLLKQWSGQLPNLTVFDPSYRGGTPQGRMPSDGVEGALRALTLLRSEGTLVGDKLRVKSAADVALETQRQAARSRAKERTFEESAAQAAARAAAGKPPKRGRAASGPAADEDADTTGSGRKVTRYAPPDWRKRRVFENSVAGDSWPDRLVTRYDPETGHKRRVPEIDPFDQWPSTKAEWKRSGGVLEQLAGGRGGGSSQMRTTIANRISRAGLVATAGLVTKFSTIAAAAGMSPAVAAALVVAVGAGAYFGTRAVINAIERANDPAVKRSKIAL